MDCRLIFSFALALCLIPSITYANPSTIVYYAVTAFNYIGGTATVAKIATYVATSIATNYVLNALAPQPQIPNLNSLGSSNGGATSQGTTTVGGYNISGIASAADHQIIYGQTRVGGVIVFKEVTDNNRFLHVVYAMAGHICEEVSKIYLNGEELTINGSNFVTAPSKYVDGSDNFIRVKIHLGDQTTGDSDLVSESSKWTSDHKLRNITYIYVRYEFQADAFPNGEPNLTALIKGKKVYNVNTGATAWSDNTALVIRDYLTSSYGLNIPTADLDDTAFATAQTGGRYRS